MNATVRMMADARSLFWLWCVVAVAGILSLFRWQRLPGGLEMEVLAGFGFCAGLPLLATLIYGNEFQFGTFSSLLSQPIERSRIWREKAAVMLVAVLSAGIAYGFGANRMGFRLSDIAIYTLWLMITVGSSMFWTLVARSTIGGLALNGLQSMALILALVPQLNRRPQPLLPLAAFAVVYTAVMFYLGRRRLLRFQITGTGPSFNLAPTGWTVTPRPLLRLLRCTASGGSWNLVRKELRLLWPLAPLMLIASGILLAIVPFRFSGHQDWIVGVGIAVTLTHGFFAAILAGVASLGEERSLGLHSWNLTLPVSIPRQWAIKLVTALCTSAACSGAVVLVAHLLLGPAFLQQFTSAIDGYYLALFPLLTFVPFWCAAGVNGAVRAAFWCIPTTAAVFVAYDFGSSFAMGYTMVEIVATLTQWLHPYPFTFEVEVMAWKLTWFQKSIVAPTLWVNLWLLPPAAIQSYRLFRSEIRDSVRPLVRATLVLAAIGLLSGFLQHLPAAATGTMVRNSRRAFDEISRGVAMMQIAPAAVGGDGGYRVSLETLARSAALSAPTRAWLASDTLVIRPKPSSAVNDPQLNSTRYLITAELHGGWKCTFADNFYGDRHPFLCKARQGKLGWLEVDL